MALPEPVARGVALFDRGAYFEAHEAWEEHWGAGAKAERDLVKGLIKVAVAFHHLRHANVAGCLGQIRDALPLLRANADVWPELGVADFAEEVDSVAAQVRFHGDAKELPRFTNRTGTSAG